MYERGQVFGRLLLFIFPIIVLIVLDAKNKKRFPIIVLFLVFWLLYLIPMEVRPYFKGNHDVLFWLGFIPNLGCAFALPIIGLKNKSLTYYEARKKLLISSLISLGLILSFEVSGLMRGFGTFDWLDVLMTVLGTVSVNIIFRSFKSKFIPAFKVNEI